MALVKGVNSNATVTEADTYFENRLDVAAWTDASDTQKEQSLCTATFMLDELDWIGVATDSTQSLAHPRKDGEYFDPKLGILVPLVSTVVDIRVTKATYELAYHLLNNDGLLDNTGLIKDLELSGIKLSVIRPADKIPMVAKTLIKPLLRNSGKRTWWRAN
jgi:hypothetical protein